MKNLWEIDVIKVTDQQRGCVKRRWKLQYIKQRHWARERNDKLMKKREEKKSFRVTNSNRGRVKKHEEDERDARGIKIMSQKNVLQKKRIMGQ